MRGLARYPAWVLFLVMGLVGGAGAWLSFDVIRLTMANVDLVQRHGGMALLDGGLIQALMLGLRGLLILALYLAFKLLEVELVTRWRAGPRGPDRKP